MQIQILNPDTGVAFDADLPQQLAFAIEAWDVFGMSANERSAVMESCCGITMTLRDTGRRVAEWYAGEVE